jgi:hypothetical protein
MRYMKWIPYYELGEREAPLDVFYGIRDQGWFIDALHNTEAGEVVCIISDETDLSILDPKWQAVEVTVQELMEILRKRDPEVILRPDGTPIYPTEILANSYLELPIDYI